MSALHSHSMATAAFQPAAPEQDERQRMPRFGRRADRVRRLYPPDVTADEASYLHSIGAIENTSMRGLWVVGNDWTIDRAMQTLVEVL